MKLLAFSDTHLLRQKNIEIPKEHYDLLIFCGDMCNAGNSEEEVLLAFDWFAKFNADKKIIIPGNHDRILDDNTHIEGLLKTKNFECWKDLALKNYGLTLIKDGLIKYRGLSIYCSAYSELFGDWAFMKSHDEYKKYLGGIPKDVDILCIHNMPYYKDELRYSEVMDWHGSLILRNAIKNLTPTIFIGGHCHRDYNELKRPYIQTIGKTLCYNVSLLDDSYDVKWDFTTINIG